jgi:hypothetical protein
MERYIGLDAFGLAEQLRIGAVKREWPWKISASPVRRENSIGLDSNGSVGRKCMALN